MSIEYWQKYKKIITIFIKFVNKSLAFSSDRSISQRHLLSPKAMAGQEEPSPLPFPRFAKASHLRMNRPAKGGFDGVLWA